MEKVTLSTLQQMKQERRPIVMLTAYDYPSALIMDESGVDMILVGDSVGMVVHGFETTLPVTMDMMVLHCQAVRRGAKRAFLVGDMPFMSYQASLAEAKRNAGRLLAEGGMDAVKLEGGQPVLETVRGLVQMGIAVQGHLGLTPQSVSALGGFRTQGKTLEAARQLITDALALQEAGAFSLVLEAVPARLASLITRLLHVPTIGIGAGGACDGQVLVMHDLLGLYQRFTPKFVKRYGEIAGQMQAAFEQYRDEVRDGRFPGEEHEFGLADEVWKVLENEYTPGQDH